MSQAVRPVALTMKRQRTCVLAAVQWACGSNTRDTLRRMYVMRRRQSSRRSCSVSLAATRHGSAGSQRPRHDGDAGRCLGQRGCATGCRRLSGHGPAGALAWSLGVAGSGSAAGAVGAAVRRQARVGRRARLPAPRALTRPMCPLRRCGWCSRRERRTCSCGQQRSCRHRRRPEMREDLAWATARRGHRCRSG